MPANNQKPLDIRGVNYYPAQHGWWRMWVEPWAGMRIEISDELDRAQQMGMNTIRTFLPFSVLEPFRVDELDASHQTEFQHVLDNRPAAAEVLDRLDDFLTWVDGRHMKAIIGLFDEAPFLPLLIAAPLRALDHLDRILTHITDSGNGPRLGDDARILMWDLVNEMDDYPQKSTPSTDPHEPLPRPWLIQPMFYHDETTGDERPRIFPTPKTDSIWPFVPEGLDFLRRIVNRMLNRSSQQFTFGTLLPNSARELLRQFPDPRHVPQYHEYSNPTRKGVINLTAYAADVTARMRLIFDNPDATHPRRRVLIGELGMPSAKQKYGIVWTPLRQSKVMERALQIAAANTDAVQGVLVWTLTDWGDFSQPGRNDNQADEKFRGLYEIVNGKLKKKPVADVVASIFGGHAV